MILLLSVGHNMNILLSITFITNLIGNDRHDNTFYIFHRAKFYKFVSYFVINYFYN